MHCLCLLIQIQNMEWQTYFTIACTLFHIIYVTLWAWISLTSVSCICIARKQKRPLPNFLKSYPGRVIKVIFNQNSKSVFFVYIAISHKDVVFCVFKLYQVSSYISISLVFCIAMIRWTKEVIVLPKCLALTTVIILTIFKQNSKSIFARMTSKIRANRQLICYLSILIKF